MRTSMSNGGHSSYYTVREVAWILDVPQSTVARAIRVGTVRAVRRRGRLVITAGELARLLPGGAP